MSPVVSLAVTLLAFAIGWVLGLASVRGTVPRRALPPSTARQLRRAARANRLELRKPPARWIPPEFPHYEETRR